MENEAKAIPPMSRRLKWQVVRNVENSHCENAGARVVGQNQKGVLMETLNYESVPVDYMAGAVQRYIESGIPPGHFLTAVICNDLFEAFSRADDSNSAAMHGWVRWFYNEAPRGCWGSLETMKDWMKSRHGHD